MNIHISRGSLTWKALAFLEDVLKGGLEEAVAHLVAVPMAAELKRTGLPANIKFTLSYGHPKKRRLTKFHFNNGPAQCSQKRIFLPALSQNKVTTRMVYKGCRTILTSYMYPLNVYIFELVLSLSSSLKTLSALVTK